MSNFRASILAIATAAIGGIILVGLLIFIIGYLFINNGELGDKEKFAIVQSMELNFRGQIVSENIILKRKVNGTKYDVLGLPTENEKYPMAWVLLNDLDYQGSAIFIPPAMRLKAECQQLSGVLQNIEVRPEVRLALTTKMKCSMPPENKKT